MLTIFSTPKAFRGHFAAIQRNAIGSWVRLSPAPQVILFGESEGTREAAEEFGVEHVRSVEANEFGTPYLHSMIACAERMARFEQLCYVNADIILTEGFERAVAAIPESAKKFLMVGARMNLDLDGPIAFDGDWRARLRGEYGKRGAVGDHTSIDFFVFSKGLYEDIPPLAIGRAWFDQWMIKAALERGVVVDTSALVPIVHQNHDYGHVSGGRESVFKGVEAQRNLAHCGGEHAYTLLDCTHEMAADGAIKPVRLRREKFQARQKFWDLFIRRTVGIRDALRLRRKYWTSDEAAAKRRAT